MYSGTEILKLEARAKGNANGRSENYGCGIDVININHFGFVYSNTITSLSTHKHILLIEDNDADQLLFQEYLRASMMKEWEILNAESIREALPIIEDQLCDIAILDLSLPDSLGLDGLTKIREVNQYLPVIILTGWGESELGMKAIQQGAQDYLVKDGLNEHVLEKSIVYSLERALLNKQDQQDTIDRLRETQKKLLKKQLELEQALEREKELSQLRTQFISGASHQFRTPLAVIKSNSELLLSMIENKDERFDRISKRINNEMRRITELMDDLLKINTFTVSDYQSRMTETDLVALCKECIDGFEMLIPDVSATPPLAVKGKPFPVMLDGEIALEALNNTLTYVIRYQKKPTVPGITVKFEEDEVKVIVFPSGVQLSDEQRKQIFQPFYQPDNLPDYQGSALGIFLARQYVELNQGSMVVQAEEDGDTCFAMCFQRSKNPTQSSANPSDPGS